MGGYLRLFAAFIIFAPLSAMFSEPFFEALYDAMGWDTEDLAGPVFRTFSGMTALPYFWQVSIALVFLGAGVWLHYLATRYDRNNLPYAVKLAKEVRDLSTDIAFRGQYPLPQPELMSRYEIVSRKLNKLGIPMAPFSSGDPTEFLAGARTALDRIEPYLSANNVKDLRRLIKSKIEAFDPKRGKTL